MAKKKGTVVQLVRAPPCHGGSCGFEPRQSRTQELSEGFQRDTTQ